MANSLLLFVCGPPALAAGSAGAGAVTEDAEAETGNPLGDLDLRLSASFMYSDDDVTAHHLSVSDFRFRLDGSRILGFRPLEVHGDVRYRERWNKPDERRYAVSRLYLQYGNRQTSWLLALGRVAVDSVAGLQVDGGLVGVRIFDNSQIAAFGGLRPHPLTNEWDYRFSTFGATYDLRRQMINYGGGAVLDLFVDQVDRAYLSQRFFARLSAGWSTHGFAVVDFLLPQGVGSAANDLQQRDPRQFGPGADLTHANVGLRYRYPKIFDATLSGAHTHTVVPNRWWEDWVLKERARRGFVVDGFEPVGSRRTTARLKSNLKLVDWITPFIRLRYDHRHDDSGHAFEVRPGARAYASRALWAEVFYRFRHGPDTINHHVSASAGWDILAHSGVEASFAALHSTKDQAETVFYDLSALLRFGLVDVAAALEGFDLIAQYQGFLEPRYLLHVFFIRLGYRLRTSA